MANLTSEEAIRKAVDYLKSLSAELLGENPEEIRLETVQLFEDNWVVILSYLVRPEIDNAWLKAFQTYRRYKEITLSVANGDVLSFRTIESNGSGQQSRVASR